MNGFCNHFETLNLFPKLLIVVGENQPGYLNNFLITKATIIAPRKDNMIKVTPTVAASFHLFLPLYSTIMMVEYRGRNKWNEAATVGVTLIILSFLGAIIVAFVIKKLFKYPGWFSPTTIKSLGNKLRVSK